MFAWRVPLNERALWWLANSGRVQRWSLDRTPLPAATRLVVIDLHPQNPVYWREPAVAAEARRGLRATARS